MKIIITVNFANDKFNNDFNLSNALLNKHTVLMVSSNEQLIEAKNHYDLVIIGQSSQDIDMNNLKDIEYLDANKDKDKINDLL